MAPEYTPADDGDLPSRHSLGPVAVPDPTPLRPVPERIGAGGERNGAERTGADGTPGAWFAVVLRGYDRAQVDARLAELDRRIRDEIMRADAAESALSTARSHVRRLQDTPAPAADERSFGLRVERVLNAAEREAAEVREAATREADALREKAREEADRARRQTEEALLERAAKLDDEFSARSAALDAREQEVDRIVERARRDADEIRAGAERVAADASSEAERRSADLVRAAEETIERERADATRDIGRMATLRDEVRQELSRLQDLLRTELGSGRDDRSASDSAVAPLSALPSLTALPGYDDTDTAAHNLSASPSSSPSSPPSPSPSPSPSSDIEDTAVRPVVTGGSAIGTIPPYTVASIGVLPFGDRSAGGPANGRSFSFELVPDMRSDDDGSDDERSGRSGRPDPFRTSVDATRDGSDGDRNPTRSTTPSRGSR